jgi:VanZ like family
MAWIYWLSSARRDLLPPGPLGAFVANAAHGPIFGVLAALAARATGSAPLGFAIGVLYGVGDEWHQSYVPGRSSSPFDLATDTVGALAALGLLATPLAEATALRRVIAVALALAVAAGLATAFS